MKCRPLTGCSNRKKQRCLSPHGSEFLNLSKIDIWDQRILCPMDGKNFSNTPGLSTHEVAVAYHHPQLRQPQMSQDIATCPVGSKASPAENHCLRYTEPASRIFRYRFFKQIYNVSDFLLFEQMHVFFSQEGVQSPL